MEEIRAAYLRLAAHLHPDKHSRSGLRNEAETQFTRVDRAYKVLTDPLLRQAYDTHGEQVWVGNVECRDLEFERIDPCTYTHRASDCCNRCLKARSCSSSTQSR
jgi:DnaJ-class molecular chaperone